MSLINVFCYLFSITYHEPSISSLKDNSLNSQVKMVNINKLK